ncbi:MAG: hypothetical protein WCF92_01085 [bacterium]
MKDLLQKFKTPLIIIVLLGLAFVFYNMFFKPAAETSTLVSNPTSSNSISADFLPLLLKIQDIKFDQGFFSYSTYTSLKDFGQTIVSEDTQRTDPFAPIFGVGASSSTVEGLGFTVQTVIGTSTPATTKAPATVKTK